MFSLNYLYMREELQRVVKQSQEKNEAILFTYTEKCENMHPLLFLTNNRTLFQGKRFFYTNKSQSVIKVGIGHTKTFALNNEDDILSLQKEMTRLKDSMIKTGTVTKTPVLFGGLPFFMNEEPAEEWSDFKRGFFVLPFLLLDTNEEGSYITITREITPSSNVETIIADLKEVENEFMKEWKKERTAALPTISHREETPLNQWQDWIRKAKVSFSDGIVDKVVLARRKHFTYTKAMAVEAIVENLLTHQHNSYVFLFEVGSSAFLGASPEKLIEKKGNEVVTMALAGSMKRGKTIKEDQLYGQYLLSDEKNLWEHEVVVRSIIEVLREFGLDPLYNTSPTLMKMKDIQHLYTKIEAINDSNIPLLSLVQKLHPTPALGGYPKKEACEIIASTENYDRGFYAAPLGFMTLDDEGEFFVALRSGLVKEKEVYLYAGCGLVQHSDPLLEYDETETKFKPMLRALGVEM